MGDNLLWKKSVIHRVLELQGKTIRKSLGQHYLTNPGVVQKIGRHITRLSQNNPSAGLLEIGPGLGVLTQEIISKLGGNFTNYPITAVEIDPSSIACLKEAFAEEMKEGRLSVIEKDILTWVTEEEGSDYQNSIERESKDENEGESKWVIYGNLPYQISSAIFFRLCQVWYNCLAGGVFMIQREVADRIRSKSGSRRYGILSVLLQHFFTVKSVVRVSPGSFYPPPKVDSEVIELIPNYVSSKIDDCQVDPTIFIHLLKASFHNRRKYLLKSIGNWIEMVRDQKSLQGSLDYQLVKDAFNDLNFSPDLRAEALPVEDFVRLENHYRILKNKK